MPHAYHEIAFTDAVKAQQEAHGSRASYERFEAVEARRGAEIGRPETAFLAERDSFYMATVNAKGWPYIQHRGGPMGFVRVLDAKTIGFADFSGNRQYVSLGNLKGDDRVSLFFMDYANRRRLKAFGRVRVIDHTDPAMAQLIPEGYGADIERGILIGLEGFEWNCPQHITERFTLADVETATEALRARIADLEAQLAARDA